MRVHKEEIKVCFLMLSKKKKEDRKGKGKERKGTK
jgi:hypothetical protein